MYPSVFEKLISQLEKLPGVGNKTAQRYAFSLLEKDSDQIDELTASLNELRNIRKCRICGFLSDEEECGFCKDSSRNKNTIMVVANAQDVLAIEKTGSYKGVYHVLNGLICYIHSFRYSIYRLTHSIHIA